MSLYDSNKQHVQDIKKFLKPHTMNKIRGEVPKEQKGKPTAPQNRILPIRGQ